MNERERCYAAGRARAWIDVLGMAVRELGYDKPRLASMGSLVKERAEAVLALRKACAVYGDNDWSDDLHLADVIEKHMGEKVGHRV